MADKLPGVKASYQSLFSCSHEGPIFLPRARLHTFRKTMAKYLFRSRATFITPAVVYMLQEANLDVRQRAIFFASRTFIMQIANVAFTARKENVGRANINILANVTDGDLWSVFFRLISHLTSA